MDSQKRYDVAISFAGEDRKYAEDLANSLTHRGVAVFYDAYEKATLWGKNLYTHLSDLYQNQARYCVMLLSRHYAAKVWTKHELEAAQARAFQEHKEYILPVRLDNTEIPGILPTVAYLQWPPENAESITDAILAKLGKASQAEASSSSKPKQTAKIVYCTRCGATPGDSSNCNGPYTSHSFVRLETPVYCTRCGATPGKSTTCNDPYTSHDFSRFEKDVYCSRCGAVPGKSTKCNEPYSSHDFVAT